MPVRTWFSKASRDTATKPDGQAALAPFARPIALTHAGMILERGLRAFWPLLSVLALIASAVSFALPAYLGGLERWFWLAALLVTLATLGWGVWKMRWPSRADAVARLDATLPGRPLSALTDDMALGQDDPAARALWAAHLRRMAVAAQAARAPRPDPDLARRDPYALRITALTALVMALVFGVPQRLLNPTEGLPGPAGSAEAAMGPSWEGWASPPRYTGKPGLYLNKVQGDELIVPEGTRFSIRLYGAPGSIAFSESVSNPAALPEQGAAQTTTGIETREFEAVRDGLLEFKGPAARRFNVVVRPDEAPSVALAGTPERRADGKLSLPFTAQDDYAVAAGHAVITLDLAKVDRRYGLEIPPELRDDLVYDLPLPISGSRAEFTESLVEDAAKHPWANLPVKLTLDVEDGRGQTGTSGVQEIILPGKRFFDPLAAALIEVRRDLLWSRDNRELADQLLRTLTNRHEGFIKREEVYLMIRLVIGRLEDPDLSPEARDEIAEALWKMAELVEDGGLADALAAMQKAQEKLSEAIRNGASKDEIAKLMQELKEATDNYIRMLAERSQEQEQGPQFGQQQQGQQITGDQIQQMMDQIQKLMEEGRMAEAQELLDQLARMMENLKVQQGQGGQGDMPGNQAMRDMQDTLRKQQELSDDAFRNLQEQFMSPEERRRAEQQGRQSFPNNGQPGQQGEQQRQGQQQGQQGQGQQGQGQQGQQQGQGQQPGDQPGQGQGQEGQAQRDGQGQGDQPGLEGGQGGVDGQSLADRQRALRRELDRQRGLLPGFGNEAGQRAEQRFDEAGRAMDQAEEALREGDNSAAIDRQADAIQALREGMRALGEAMRNEQARQQGGQQPGQQGQQLGGQPGQNGTAEVPRDPLGRAQGDGSRIGTERDMLQGEDVYRRAQDLLDEIRRRSADRLRPEEELDYLKRLLDQFSNAG